MGESRLQNIVVVIAIALRGGDEDYYYLVVVIAFAVNDTEMQIGILQDL